MRSCDSRLSRHRHPFTPLGLGEFVEPTCPPVGTRDVSSLPQLPKDERLPQATGNATGYGREVELLLKASYAAHRWDLGLACPGTMLAQRSRRASA